MEESKFYVVYSGSEKLDLSDKPKPVAILLYEKHADYLIQKKWPGYGYIKPVSKEGLLKLIEEEF